MARVYADVNQHMPKSYWEYDSVNITWGILENYEVVRKIGGPAEFRAVLAGAQSRALTCSSNIRQGQILGSLRGNKYCELPEVRNQGSEACQKEKNQEGDQDPAEPERRAQCGCIVGCRQGQPEQDTFPDLRVCQQYGFQEPISKIRRLRRAILHLRASEG